MSCSSQDSVLLWAQNAYRYGGGPQKVMVIRDACPRCASSKYKKNGQTHNGKQHHHCKACGQQFVQYSDQSLIPAAQRALMERLLLERIALRGICRAAGVGLKWLLGLLVMCFQALPDHGQVQALTCDQG